MEERKRSFKWLYILIAVIVIFASLAAAQYALLWPRNILEELVVEAGTDSVFANDFRKTDRGHDAQILSDLTAVDLSQPGTHPVCIQYRHRTYDCTIRVQDTTAPQAVIQDVSVYSDGSVAPEDFVTEIVDATAVTLSWESQPDLSIQGQSQVTVILTDAAGNTAEYQAMLTVLVDTTAPEIRGVKEIYTYLGTEPDYLSGVSAQDDRDGDVAVTVDAAAVDLSAVGTYEIRYTAADAMGNIGTVTGTVTVTDDAAAPVIRGIRDITVYLGSTVSYRSGVLVTDDQDEAPKLEIDSSKVNLSQIGTYTVIYTARDKTGNIAQQEVTVTVVEKPETYVEEAVIYAKVDELLAKIIKEDMDDTAKARAIYNHLRWSYGYTNHSDKTDWLQGAWVMMHEGRGDCFNYFALTKLMLERCGIPNIDVRKVRNSERDADHFWSLVSVDGGKTYYHLDTTPRIGDDDNFFLVTDAYLDAYSAANRGSHNRDKALYPATPEA